MWEQAKSLEKSVKNLEKVHSEFLACKRKERIQVSLKRSEQRLIDENRAKLKELRDLLGWWENSAPGVALLAKILPDHEFGRKSAQELTARGQRLEALGKESRSELPAAHRDFLAAATE